MHAPHRANEFAADAFSVGTCHDADALIGGLKSLSRNSLVNLTPHWLHVRVTRAATSARPRSSIALLNRAPGRCSSTTRTRRCSHASKRYARRRRERLLARRPRAGRREWGAVGAEPARPRAAPAGRRAHAG